MQEQHRENVKIGMAEKAMHTEIQRNFDKQYGFYDFPYTHGDDIEKAKEDATRRWRIELTEELQRRRAGKQESVTTTTSPRSSTLAEKENQLIEKAKNLTEAKGKYPSNRNIKLCLFHQRTSVW